MGGGHGSTSFETMMRMGLYGLAQQGILPVVSLHVYTASMIYYPRVKKEIERLPASVQVWITETGVDDWQRQIPYVLDMYPKIRQTFRASRIYWYVFSECSEFSLVTGLATCSPGPVAYSPLYRELTGIESPPMAEMEGP
jgi:hypothetical protein